jgi:hypothetical protein
VPCNNVYLKTQEYNTNLSRGCYWNGGILALWAATGNSSYVNVTILQDYTTYATVNATHQCTTLYNYYNLSAGNYTVEMSVGSEVTLFDGLNNSCNSAIVVLNRTIANNVISYDIVNGNFSTGTYDGWITTGKAFGSGPLNLSWANEKSCYPQTNVWNGYNGTYFATTYNCTNHISAVGNLTSNQFVVTKPFLNFQVISAGPRTYVEIIYKDSPYIKAYFSTYALSGSGSGAFMLRNATIPLTTVFGNSVQIRVVANESKSNEYIVIGNFKLSDTPNQQQGILTNITFSNP